jgi:hypothetical protein
MDEDAFLPIGLARFLKAGCRARFFHDVDLVERASNLVGNGLAAFFIEIEDAYLHALAGKRIGRGAGQARCAASHYCRNTIVQFHPNISLNGMPVGGAVSQIL